ncbi:MAG: DUF3256 family protein [Bacteroidales bacterium]
MVKRRISVAIISIMVSLATYAKDIHDFFVSEPNQIFNHLTTGTRLDMIDYYNSGAIVELENQIYGTSKLTKLTDNYISVKLSENLLTEVKMLPISKKDTILVVSQTIYAPTPDSKISIYDTQWQELELAKYFKTPTLADFIDAPRKGELSLEMIEPLFPFLMIEYKLNADNNNIEAILGAKSLLTTERYKKIEPILTDTLNYTLKGRKFKQIK